MKLRQMRFIRALQIQDSDMLFALSVLRTWKRMVIAVQLRQQLVIVGRYRKYSILELHLNGLLNPCPWEYIFLVFAPCAKKCMDQLRVLIFFSYANCLESFEREYAAHLHE